MTDVETQSDDRTLVLRSRRSLVIAIASLGAVGGLVSTLKQFDLSFVDDEFARTRIIGRVLYISLGVIGLYLLFRLIRKWREFAELTPKRKGLNFYGVPVGYLLLFAACVVAWTCVLTLILERSFAPTAVVAYDATRPNNRTSIEFRSALRKHHRFGVLNHASDEDDDVERFNASFYQVVPGRDRKQMGTLNGQTRVLEDGRVEIRIDVDSKERLQFSVRGLDKCEITRDGESINQSDAKSGKYKIVIVGHPEKHT